MTQKSTEFVSIHTVANRFEADLLMDALHQEGIEAYLRNFEETPYDGLFVSQRGWGLIMVSPDTVTEAREMLQPLIDDLQTKKLYSEPSDIDPLLWKRLREADPEEICVNAQIRYDHRRAAFIIPFLNGKFHCFPDEERIEALQPTPYNRLNFELHLVMLHYLLEAKNEALPGNWISEKDIPGGQLFFRGPHRFQTDPLIELFGNRPEVFRIAAEGIGGTPVNMGDLAYRLWPFPRIPLLFVLWLGDEEFEPALHIRFNQSITAQLHTLDTIWALVNLVSKNLKAAAGAAL